MPKNYPLGGCTALVTGASAGIGAEFADQLALRGANLILIARNATALEERAVQLRASYGVQVRVIAVDLADRRARGQLLASLEGTRVDLLVNNAGIGSHGPFATLEVQRELAEVELNCAAVVDLSRALLPKMLASGNGAIINVASTASFQPCPGMATYGATKAFVLSFSLALATEYDGHGVRIVAFCPGAVSTGFAYATGDQAFASSTFVSKAPTPRDVVPAALRALDRGRTVCIPGRRNRIGVWASRLVPWSVSAKVSQRVLNR